jgi:hypothetical protein
MGGGIRAIFLEAETKYFSVGGMYSYINVNPVILSIGKESVCFVCVHLPSFDFSRLSLARAEPVAARSEARTLIARTLDRGFESRLKHECLSSYFYVVLSCVGRGLATS